MKNLCGLLILILLSKVLPAQWISGNAGLPDSTLIDHSNFLSVFFTDVDTGYITFYDYINTDTRLIKTTNGGITWFYPTANYFWAKRASHSLFFISSDTGYALSVIKTVDGGENWNLSNSYTYCLQDIFFTDADTGFVCGACGFDYGNKIILKTTDGGLNWITQISGIGDIILYSIFFPEKNIGYAVGSLGTIVKTINGGLYWYDLIINTNFDFYDLAFPSADTGYVVGGNACIYKTTDGGNTWNLKYLNPEFEFRLVSFTDINTGYAVGYSSIHDNLLLKTYDGGETWLEQESDLSFYFPNDMIFPSQDTGYMVTSKGILRTINGGGLPSGINDRTNLNDLIIFPNPPNIRVTLNLHSQGLIYIYDINGKIVKQVNVFDDVINIDIEDFSRGIYLIKFIGENIVRVGKFIKQ